MKMDALTHENEWKVNEMLNRMEADGREEAEWAVELLQDNDWDLDRSLPAFRAASAALSARTSTAPAGQPSAVYVAHDDVAGESRTAPAVQVASAAGSVAHCQPRASELSPLSPGDDIPVELGFHIKRTKRGHRGLVSRQRKPLEILSGLRDNTRRLSQC